MNGFQSRQFLENIRADLHRSFREGDAFKRSTTVESRITCREGSGCIAVFRVLDLERFRPSFSEDHLAKRAVVLERSGLDQRDRRGDRDRLQIFCGIDRGSLDRPHSFGKDQSFHVRTGEYVLSDRKSCVIGDLVIFEADLFYADRIVKRSVPDLGNGGRDHDDAALPFVADGTEEQIGFLIALFQIKHAVFRGEVFVFAGKRHASEQIAVAECRERGKSFSVILPEFLEGGRKHDGSEFGTTREGGIAEFRNPFRNHDRLKRRAGRKRRFSDRFQPRSERDRGQVFTTVQNRIGKRNKAIGESDRNERGSAERIGSDRKFIRLPAFFFRREDHRFQLRAIGKRAVVDLCYGCGDRDGSKPAAVFECARGNFLHPVRNGERTRFCGGIEHEFLSVRTV